MKWCEHSLTACTLLGNINLFLEKRGKKILLKYMHLQGGTQLNTAGSPEYDALDSAALFVLVAVLSVCTQLTVLENMML